MAEKCKECGCKCSTCSQDNQQHCDMHLHAEIENLRQRLLERDNHIVTMETQFLSEADKFPNGELASMKEELLVWQEKYSRLHEAHKRVQKINQNLEDKLLRIVDKCETEKGAFTKDIATLSHRLADANYTIHRLTQDNEKYRNDVSLAIQLLQCKPSNFVGQKYDSLPSEVQAKVRTYVAQKRCSTQDPQPDIKSITVPISTFPPTAMVYNITKPTVEKHSDDDSDDSKPPMDMVSAAIMAKVLEDREKERIFAKHCDTCTCHRSILMVDTETQTCVTDTFPISESYTYGVEKQASEGTVNDEKYQSKDKLQSNFTTHTVFYEINENGNKIRHHMNGDYVKYASQIPCIKDKFVGRNSSRNGQDYTLEEDDVTMRTGLNKKNSSQNENKRSSSFSRLNDLNRINIDKTSKPLRTNKCDSPVGSRSAKYWSERNFFGHFGTVNFARANNRLSDKEQTHIDIINDRLWKNKWTKWKSETDPLKENKCKTNRGIELDIINDRDWKNGRSAAEGQDGGNTAQFTVIEVKSPDNAASHNDGSQTEVTTSPSFSSDSMVISSSDPSSSCSDVALTGGAFNSSAKSNSSQSRVTGPRNCLVRVTPGSKNILLDNAGHYKTVLYSGSGGDGGGGGGGDKLSTALVHAKKISRSGSERSTSTGSEENSPPAVLLQDNQLQRVAEWVQSSMCVDNSAPHNSNKIKCIENAASDNSSSVYLNDSLAKRKSSEQDAGLARIRDVPNESSKNFENYSKRNVNNEPIDINILSEHIDESENLITFEDEHLLKDSRNDLDYEVKVTKEMEETYLKLAASLDPVTLSLSSTSKAELTIEKYRKDHKRLHMQRIQDKAGSKA